ncbi:oligosaccharide flippase family protein [Pararhizobium haloflavum]|uniref:oligosaccharide flippase family protein n=1 Tax=Pararhizobium haloflavum TaxID=2037914 RepID=UPI000C17EC27|nr:oligosaccharide flippase family protein [Pararhizobium haloflavum]
MTGVKRALFISSFDRYFAIMANILTLAIVSRLLQPEEIGVSVIGMAVVLIAIACKEFASSNFLIQRTELERGEVRSAFTVMFVLTLAISAALFAGAPVLARSYEEMRLVPYLHVIALSLLIEFVPLQLIALLRREMAFGRVALINCAGALTATVVTLALALLGFSYMSFAWAWMAQALVSAALAIACHRQIWMFRPSLRHWRAVLRFGGYNGSTIMLFKLYESLPYLMLGRLISLDAAAMFSRTLMICQLPDKVVLGGAISVILPAFSEQARQGRDLKPSYLHALAIVTSLQWPALCALAILAYPVVDLVLGDQWHAVVPLVRIVALASLFAFSFELNYPVLVSMGAVRDGFLRALIVCPVSALVVVGAAFTGSLTNVAASLAIIIPFHAFVSLHFVQRRIGLSWSAIGGAIWKSAAVALITALGPLAVAVASGYRLDLSLAGMAASVALAAPAWLLGLWVTGHPMLKELAALFPQRWHRKAGSIPIGSARL